MAHYFVPLSIYYSYMKGLRNQGIWIYVIFSRELIKNSEKTFFLIQVSFFFWITQWKKTFFIFIFYQIYLKMKKKQYCKMFQNKEKSLFILNKEKFHFILDKEKNQNKEMPFVSHLFFKRGLTVYTNFP